MTSSSFPYGPAIKKLMLARGYPWFDDQNVVTVETMTPLGELCNTGPNTFDDCKMILDGGGTIIGGPWVATSHPGYYWTENPMADGGAFIISLGPQAAWGPPGDYDGYTVWRQSEDGTILGTRDPNCTYQRQGPPIVHQNIGVHHHGGGDQSRLNIGKRAAGCQVIDLIDDQSAFMQLTMACPRYLADPQGYRLTATVLTAQDVIDAYASSPTPAPIPVPLPAPSRGIVIDTAVDVTNKLAALKAAGVTTVIGYLTTNESSAKLVGPTEAHAMAAIDMRLALVFEVWGGSGDFSHNDINAATGTIHGTFCRQYMPQLGAPHGAGVFAAIDTNCTTAQIQNLVLPYLAAFKAALGGQFRIGLYGCGAALQAALDAGILELPTWLTQSTGWNGYQAFLPKAGIVQKLPSTLAGLDVDVDTVNALDIGDFLPFAMLPPAPQLIPVPIPVPTQPSGVLLRAGRAGWFSQYSGKYAWTDTGDTPGSNALGVPDDCQGCAFPIRTNLGDWFEIHAPNGVISIEQQTDIGPATWTGRSLDISAAAAERFGYSPATFPTNGTFLFGQIDAPAAIANLTPQQQAIHFYAIRQQQPQPTPTPPVEPPVVTPLPLPPPTPAPTPPSPDNSAAINTVIAGILAAVIPEVIGALKSGATASAAPGAASTVASAIPGLISGFFGIYAIPIAVAGYGVLHLLQTQGVVTAPVTVDTAIGGLVTLGGSGLVPWLKGLSGIFGQVTTLLGQQQTKP